MKHLLPSLTLIAFLAPCITLAEGTAVNKIRLQFSDQTRAKTKRVIVVNKTNNRQLVVNFSRDFEIAGSAYEYLTRNGVDALVGEYGIVYSYAERGADPGFSEIDSKVWLKSNRGAGQKSYYVEWLTPEIKTEGSLSTVMLEQKSVLRDVEQTRATEVAKSNEAKARAERERIARDSVYRKQLQLKAADLVERGWQELGARAYNKSLVTFNDALGLQVLQGESAGRAFFGRGLSSFHQKGCAQMEADFKQVEGQPQLYSDIIYYRALCAVDQNKLVEAKKGLTEIVESNHPEYTEAARFYLGLVAEQEERFDDAEGIYADTIDFAKDEHIVALAKRQQGSLKAKQAQARYNSKVLSLMLSAGVGYDSNVLALPASVTPADVALKTKGSGAYQTLFYADVKNPLFFPLKQRFTYSFLNVGYFEKAIAPLNNLISHNVAANVDFSTSNGDQHALALSYNLNRLGKFGSSLAYLNVATLRWDGTRAVETAPGKMGRVYALGARVSHYQPQQPASSPEDGQVAAGLALTSKLSFVDAATSFGPAVNLEYKNANGKNNSYASGEVAGFYQRPIGPAKWNLNLSGDLALNASSYYASTANRLDETLKYGVNVSSQWSEYAETRLQFIGTSNFSNVAATYRYDRLQVNLLTTVFF